MAEEKSVVQEQAPKKSFYQRWKTEIVLGAILITVLLVMSNSSIQSLIHPSEPEEEILSSNVILYRFDALSNNHSQNVELWLLNDGDKTAENISVFVRVRDQSGRLLFEGNPVMTVAALRANETCTADYTVHFYVISDVDCSGNASMVKKFKVTKVFTTIEVSWSEGRHVYSKET